MMTTPGQPLAACRCCGLVQRMPAAESTQRIRCARCRTSFAQRRDKLRSNKRTLALALSALLLYPFAVGLPIMEVERLGSTHEASILSGGIELLTDGEILVGVVVLLCSVVLPLVKIAGLFLLAGAGTGLAPRLRASTWHVVELTGRWGMLDVLLVAVLVSVLKLGDLVELRAGPAALAFTGCVLLNLAASASFQPHSLWRDPE
ncbi:MAG: paraquat-inducible protein A [Planctomycetota bacterium]|nr:paraquat-inducible protein A [Planctomycetota bacterium]